jgi:transcription antitermination factor NusG
MQMFDGFEARDFEAYAPSKWQSNVFNLERMRVKDKLTSLGQQLSPMVPSPDSPPLGYEVSVEHPALWNNNTVSDQQLYFTRSEDERKELFTRNTRARPMSSLVADPSPDREHMVLCVVVSEPGVEICLKLHPNATVDRQNLVTKLTDRWHMQALVDLLANLPSDFHVGFAGGDMSAPSTLDADALRVLVQAFADGSASSNPSETKVIVVGRTFEPEAVCEAESGFADLARETLQALLPLYQHLAWSRQNDFVEAKEAIRKDKQVKKARGIRQHDSIRVNRGLFSGKTGVVESIDAKGLLKVRLGTMVVKLDAKDASLK